MRKLNSRKRNGDVEVENSEATVEQQHEGHENEVENTSDDTDYVDSDDCSQDEQSNDDIDCQGELPLGLEQRPVQE